MIDITVLPAFIAASLVIILSPGADTVLLLRYAIRGGRRDGFLALIGILLGLTVVSGLLVSGVGVLVNTQPGALNLLTLLGTVVLFVLGAVSIAQAISLARDHQVLEQDVLGRNGAVALTTQRPLLAALITNATNPKVLIFYLAFFPQFVGNATSVTWQLVLLAIVFLVVATLWLIPLVYAASAMREFFARPRVAIALEITAGAVFLLLATLLLISWVQL
ncbi:MAG: threonine/homoserine/homoserine lactone efflux protein [Pontimonas sp.]